MAYFIQCKLKLDAQVGASPLPTAPSGTAAAEETFKRATTAEDITKLREDIIHVHVTAAEATATYTLMTEAIITISLLRIA